jgi:hypothetical protein
MNSRFESHFAQCRECRQSPLGLCPEGQALLNDEAMAQPVTCSEAVGKVRPITQDEHNQFPAGRWNTN